MVSIKTFRRFVRGLLALPALFLFATIIPRAAWATPSSDAIAPLTDLAKLGLPVVSELAQELKGLYKNVAAVSGAYTLEDAEVLGLKGTYVLFKPAGATKFMFAALFKDIPLDRLGQSSFFDGTQPKTVLMVFSTPSVGSAAVSAWPAALKKMDPAPTTLYIQSGLNMYIPLKNSMGSDAIDMLKDIGLSLDGLRVEVRVSVDKQLKQKISATVVTTSAWENPYGLKDTKLKNMALQFAISKSRSNRTKRTVQAWGDFVLGSKTYFLWGSQSNSSPASKNYPPTRAFSLAASSIAMSDLMKFVDAIPTVGDYHLGATVNNNLPTDKVFIKNSKYAKPAADSLPDKGSYVMLYAEPGESIANTGESGPKFYANGELELLGWKAASLKLELDPKKGRMEGGGTVASPPTGSLPLGAGTRMFIDVDALQNRFRINIAGSATIEGVTLAGASFDVSKTHIKGSVDLGCVPPMLKATVDASLGSAKIPAPGIGASECAEKVAGAIGDAAKAAGHALTNTSKVVGDSIKGLIASLKGEKGKKTNASIPLWETAARHMMVTNMIADMKAKGIAKVTFNQALAFPAGFGMDAIDVPITVTKAQLKKAIETHRLQERWTFVLALQIQKQFGGRYY